MDADGSHAPKHIKDLLNMGEKFDVVIGSRYIKNGGAFNWSLFRKTMSKAANIYARILCGLNINDVTSGFMRIHGELLSQIDYKSIRSKGFAFLIELKFQLIKLQNKRAGEIPIVF